MKTVSILAAALLVLAGCSTYNGGMTSSSNSDMGMMGMPGMMGSPDIAAIMTAANEGEVQEGQAAAAKATSSAVRDFANMMVSDHTKALGDARAAFDRNHIVASDNETSRTLRSGAQQTITALNTYSGSSFDRTYMQSQVDVHQWLLSQLDSTFIPSARGELRTLLQSQRAAVAMHLEHARSVLGSL